MAMFDFASDIVGIQSQTLFSVLFFSSITSSSDCPIRSNIGSSNSGLAAIFINQRDAVSMATNTSIRNDRSFIFILLNISYVGIYLQLGI